MIAAGQLAHHARAMPDAPALVFDQQTINWHDLLALTLRVASWLKTHSRAGDSIALNLPNSPAFTVFFLAAGFAGREALVFDQAWPSATTQALIAQLRPALCINVSEQGADGAGPALGQQLGQALGNDTFSFAALQARFATQDELAPQDGDLNPQCFFTGFTSGSTGLPKGYRRDHRSWLESFAAEDKVFHFRKDDCVLAPGALSHSLFLYAFVRAMHAGLCCILLKRFNPARVIESAAKYNASVLYAVPSQLALLLELAEHTPAWRNESLRWILTSGAKWPMENKQKLRPHFPRAIFAEFYGASETSFISVRMDGDGAPPDSAGKAFPGVEINLRNAHGGACAPLASGEIFVRSAMVFRGYSTDQAQDQTQADGWVASGDFGYFDAQGFLHLSGRNNRMIVTSGKNLFPEEVEQVLREHPLVQEAAVMAIADVQRGERLVGLVNCAPDARLRMRDLIAFCRPRLPLYKIPRHYFSVAAWPMTRSHKTAFAELQEGLARGLHERLPR